MPKIIVKIPNIKAKGSAVNMVEYIAKREGVDTSVNNQIVIKAPTKKQMEYIDELLKICPDAKESYEYEDYIENPTRQNASAFISIIAEQNPQIFSDTETYLNYIATRPNVEKKGEHGLFGNEDEIDIAKVKKEVSEHKAVIWTPIISLRREDAARLGYDNASAWQDLIREKQMKLAEIFGIPYENFRWYGAFHNEGHHPHMHMVVYAKDSNRGHLSEKDIESIKSMLVGEIFKDEMYHLYEGKTKARDKLAEESRNKIKELVSKIEKKDYSDSPVCDMLIQFSKKLKAVKGKKQYGYLSKSLKEDVDEIVKALASDSDIRKLYEEWCNIQKSIVGMYNDKEIEFPPLWENKEFRKIKNAVIDEALKLSDDRFSVPVGQAPVVTQPQVVNQIPSPVAQTPPTVTTQPPSSTGTNQGQTQSNSQPQSTPQLSVNVGDAAMHTLNLFYRLSRIIEDDANLKLDGFSKTIVDSKERREIIKKKQKLGIKMG